jgi:DNA-binding response OmpR family regulator
MNKILFIEDDGPTKDIYEESFGKKFDISIATTGAMGLNAAVKELPDLIILDLMLSGDMNGFDVLRELKHQQNVKDIPVVVLTNLSDQEAAVKAGGANECLVKANTPINKIEQVIRKYLK